MQSVRYIAEQTMLDTKWIVQYNDMGVYSKNILYEFITTTTRCIWCGVFNVSRRASISINEFMNIIPGKYTLLEASKYDSFEPFKQRRRIRRRKAKQKDDKKERKKGEANEAGDF